MLCKKCGAELKEDVKFCDVCGAQVEAEAPVTEAPAETAEETVEAPVETVAVETVEAPATTAAEETPETVTETVVEAKEVTETVAETVTEAAKAIPAETPAAFSGASVPEKPAKSKKGAIVAIVAAAAVAVAGIGAFATMNTKTADPKQVVIDAFKTVNPEGEVSPMEELFGWSEMPEILKKESSEITMSMKMDSCSDDEVNAYAGAGLRMGVKKDVAAKTSLMNVAVLYQDMDLANLDLYAGGETLVMAVPELTSKVFTLKIDDTLGDRVKNSPTIGPLLENNGVDIDAFLSYMDELVAQTEDQEGTGVQAFDLKTILDRYEKGCKAQDNFKAAMEVKAGKEASFTMDGQEEKCKGYDVVISKASMIDFLRTSSDFFLQDEELKEIYLKQLETTVRMSEIMGGSSMGMGSSANDMMQQGYDEMEENVDQMIGYLEESLHDVNMTVYVDKKGRLAAVSGTTVITAEDEDINVNFNWELQGGTYLTQKMLGKIVLTDATNQTITVDFTQVGTYDKNNLNYELSVNVIAVDDTVNFVYKGDYSAESGSYNISTAMTSNREDIFEITAKGVVDELEKGKWIHASLDELKFSVTGEPDLVTLSGEFGIQPLSGTIEAPTGESLDILAATEAEWQSVVTEAAFKLMAIASQLGVY